MRPSCSLAIAALGLAACKSADPPDPPRAAPAPRRVLGPATGGVRPLPPHAIRGDGVGPYRLGRPLGEILAELPLGPSMVTVDIPGIVETSVVRAEDGGVLIEGESQGEASFVAVVRPDIARTERGIMVGSTRAELEAAQGQLAIDRDHARDPRLWVGRALPTVRFIIEQDHVVGVILDRAGAAPVAEAPTSGDGGAPIEPALACSPPAAADAIALVAGGAAKPGAAAASPWCAAPDVAVSAVASGDTVALVAAAGDGRARKLATLETPGVVFAAPIADGDREDLAVVSERAGADARVYALTVYRWDGGKPERVAEQDLYRLTAATSRWIGARVEDIELLVELEVRGDDVVASGAMLSRTGGEIRDVAPLVPIVVPRREGAAAADNDGARQSPAPEDAHR